MIDSSFISSLCWRLTNLPLFLLPFVIEKNNFHSSLTNWWQTIFRCTLFRWAKNGVFCAAKMKKSWTVKTKWNRENKMILLCLFGSRQQQEWMVNCEIFFLLTICHSQSPCLLGNWTTRSPRVSSLISEGKISEGKN